MIPERKELVSAVDYVLSTHGRMELSQIYALVGHHLRLSSRDLALTDNQGQSLFKHEVRWALQTLKYEGRVKNVSKGVWARI